jgi:hypothetical protein
MRATIMQGPVFGSALLVCPTHISENALARVHRRRQIGVGVRAIIETDPAHVARRRQGHKPQPKARRMNKTTLFATLAGALLVSATAFGISAAGDSPRSLMSPADYSTAKKAIESDVHASMAKCRDQDGRSRDICKAEARADELVRKADLEAQYRGTVASAAEAKLARAKAQYEVAKTRCADQHGEDRLSCLRTARADKAKALEAAKLAST